LKNAEFAIDKNAPGMFSEGPASQIGANNIKAKVEKKKNARDILSDDMKEYLKKPNQKLLKELKDRCVDLNINFDQLMNKAKEQSIKEKSDQKKNNPANVDAKM